MTGLGIKRRKNDSVEMCPNIWPDYNVVAARKLPSMVFNVQIAAI
jgi:hypothetical protein